MCSNSGFNNSNQVLANSQIASGFPAYFSVPIWTDDFIGDSAFSNNGCNWSSNWNNGCRRSSNWGCGCGCGWNRSGGCCWF